MDVNDDDDEVSSKDQVELLNHKILFDVLNEVLPTALRTPAPMSRFLRKATIPVVLSLHGRQLLDHDMVKTHIISPAWCKRIEDDVFAFEKEIECHIIKDFIDEIINEFHQQFLQRNL
ncbi:hypothetical protein LIER_23899 [Lithospermum erythrorhizon]|uniref:DUF4378 domain-containing protein n=1 Tax=Lithospermum erythrorhizon TaxID=34254 RepID=A0AAV3QZ63_LITER